MDHTLTFVSARAFTDPSMGRRIAIIRESRGMTQSDLANALGVSQSTISRFERTPGDMKIGFTLKMCEALGISIEALASDDVEQLANLEGLTPAQAMDLLKTRRPA